MNLETLKYIKENPKRLFAMLGSRGLLNWLPDEQYIKLQFRLAMGCWPDLKNPKTYNEKLQWLKLHDRNPLYTTLVDKYAVRKYIADTLGEEYLIPLVGGPWKNADEIDFDALPEQFVLKCNHDSGGVVICKDKSKLDVEATRKALNKRLGRNFYWQTREWPYKDVQPCIFAEKYMENEGMGDFNDYKFFVFNGKAKIMYILTERLQEGTEAKADFFDMDFKHLDLHSGHPFSDKTIEKPACFDEMKRIAEELAEKMSCSRVDLYEYAGQILFGEMTLYHTSGYAQFDPISWDAEMGKWLVI